MSSWWNYSCSGCDYHQTLNPFGRTGYWSDETEYKFIELWEAVAWCQKCQTVVHAEVLISPEEIKARHAATKNRRARRNFERYVELLEQRQSPPHCLECGSTDIIYASPDGTMPHSTCGGVLSASLSALRGRAKERTHLYTFEGEFLETVDEVEMIPWNGLNTDRLVNPPNDD